MLIRGISLMILEAKTNKNWNIKIFIKICIKL